MRRMIALAALVVGSLVGCGGQGDAGVTATPPPPASGAATASPSATSASPIPSTSPTTLPESVLAPVEGLTYGRAAASDAEQLRLIQQSGSMVEGFIARQFLDNGGSIGGIIVFRNPVPPPDDATAERAVLGYLKSFTRKQAARAQLDGRTVWQVERGERVAAVSWVADRDVVIIWSDQLLNARVIAREYRRSAES